MAEILTKSRARNIFYAGSIFFVVIFIVLTVHSHRYVVNVSTAGMPLSEEVIQKRKKPRREGGAKVSVSNAVPLVEGAATLAVFGFQEWVRPAFRP